MNRIRRIFGPPALALGLGALLLTAGCTGNIFVPKQRVLVDAIAAPGLAKPAGKSYRLVARKSVVTGQQAQLPVIAACLNSALLSTGMFEAPLSVPSDIFIEVGYGMDAAGRADPATRESYLQLSARANAGRSLDSSREEELWDVRVAVKGVAGRLESAMPLLCWAAAAYAGTDTHIETTVEVPQNSPAVESVRQGALKILDSKVPATQSPPPAPARPITGAK